MTEIGSTARTVSLTATGWVVTEPDTTQISVGVLIEAETAHAALAQADTTMKHIVAGLKEAGLAARDMQPGELKVKPRYKHSEDHDEDTVDGYRAASSMSVTVRDASRIGAILKLATARGANHIARVHFGVAELPRLQDDARRRAMEAARQRGELYAQAAGARLGPVLSIAEHDEAYPSGMGSYSMARFGGTGEGPSALEMGTRRIGVQVQVVYALQ
ncbi:MAG TPA: SIMPL domain-containing protein [Hyphomicrobiaceae bacterium]|nr:SIMPL domain-containing protein [Hyphomicrobiaceae bacterium]